MVEIAMNKPNSKLSRFFSQTSIMADHFEPRPHPRTPASGQQHFPQPNNESERLAALLDYHILDTLPEQDFDDITAIASHLMGTSIALVSLLDRDRQWFKSHHGIEATETPREQAFCAHAILQPEDVLVVPNALEDERFAENPLVQTYPEIRFYAGAPLLTPEGFPLGTLCVIDQHPRTFTEAQKHVLQALARQVMAQLELRRQAAQLKQEQVELQTTLQQLRHAQAALIQSAKMSALGQLMGGIAHEINNPLTFIQGNIDLCKDYFSDLSDLIAAYQEQRSDALAEMEDDIGLDELLADLPEMLGAMNRGVNRVKRIVESLRTFASADRDGLKEIDLHQNLDSVCEMLGKLLSANREHPEIALHKDYAESIFLECYPSQINQACVNILTNAIAAVRDQNYTDATPEITLKTFQPTPETVAIAIQDNGMGMDAATQAKIFEPFFTTRPVGQGFGLGLTAAYQIVVEQHHGTLT
jgi:signal transduction histidine kinase